MPIGRSNLTESLRAWRATNPGMGDVCDLDSPYTCVTCALWQAKPKSRKYGYCLLYQRRMGSRGPQFEARQRACRQWAGR
jgi:hypothetical protein